MKRIIQSRAPLNLLRVLAGETGIFLLQVKTPTPFDFAQGRLCRKKTRQGWGTLGSDYVLWASRFRARCNVWSRAAFVFSYSC
jgi:hypothetical protein